MIIYIVTIHLPAPSSVKFGFKFLQAIFHTVHKILTNFANNVQVFGLLKFFKQINLPNLLYLHYLFNGNIILNILIECN